MSVNRVYAGGLNIKRLINQDADKKNYTLS